MSTHRETIVRRTRLYQALVVGLVALAGLGVALPMTGLFSSGPASVPPPPPPSTGTPTMLSAVDVSGAGSTLTVLTGWKEKTAAEVEEESQEPQGPKPPPPPPVNEWAYSGSMMSSTARAAIVKVDGQQHRLREGEKIGETTLVAIEPDSITIRSPAGLERKIALTTRSASWPTEAIPPRRPGGTTPGHTPPGRPGTPAGAATPPPVPQTLDGRKPKPTANRTANELSTPPMSDDQRDALMKQLRQPEMPPAAKAAALRQLGLTQGMDPGLVAARLRELGLEPINDANLNEAVKIITGATP